MNLRNLLHPLFLFMILFIASIPNYSLSSQLGSWSSGGRQDTGNRIATGWRRVGSAALQGQPMAAYFWPPAIYSSPTRTVVLWALGKQQIVGRWWDKETGTWSKNVELAGVNADLGFYLPPIPGGFVQSPPAAVYRGNDLLDVVVQGTDQYYHIYYANNKWSVWEPIGGKGGEPALTALKPDTLDVWVVAQGSVWRRRWEAGWKPWEEVGHPNGVSLITAPGVTTRSDNTIDIVAPASPSGQLWHIFYSARGGLATWKPISGNTLRKPTLSSPSPDRLDVWVKGASDGTIYHQVWTAAAGWSGFEKSVNQIPTGEFNRFTSGVAVDLSPLNMTNVAAVTNTGEVMVRTWMQAVPPQNFAITPNVQIRRPLKSPPAFIVVNQAENTSLGFNGCNAIFLSIGDSGELHKQKLNCVFDGVGAKPESGYSACDSPSSKAVPNLGSMDNQLTAMKFGTLLWLRQRGCVTTPTTRTNNKQVARGVEEIYYSNSCGGNWKGPITLDPCDPNGPFDAGFCNKNAVPPCTDSTPRTGTDRPEILASRYDDTIFMALGIAGFGKDNLVLMRAKESDPATWKAIDTGLPAGGAVSLAESPTHLFLARCEYGEPAHVGLYAYEKSLPFQAKNLIFLGYIDNASCSGGDVNISMMKNNLGLQVVRWAFTSRDPNNQFIKRGFSMLTPGGVLELQNVISKSGKAMLMPNLIASDYNNRALLYWYEFGSDGNWRIKASASDGVGRWSTNFTLSTNAWSKTANGSWAWPASKPIDYMKGSYIIQNGKMRFLTQWIQPVTNSGNEIFFGVVDW
jgi:hypothetical protein